MAEMRESTGRITIQTGPFVSGLKVAVYEAASRTGVRVTQYIAEGGWFGKSTFIESTGPCDSNKRFHRLLKTLAD